MASKTRQGRNASRAAPKQEEPFYFIDLPSGDTVDGEQEQQPSENVVVAAAQSDLGELCAIVPAEPPEVLIDGERFYRVEGDMLLDVDELDLYRQQRAAEQAQHEAAEFARGFGWGAINELVGQSSALVGMVQGGKLVRWAPGTVLSYCVLSATFPREEWYQEVVENMQLATTAWEEACGVQFAYRADLDSSTSLRPQGALFPVRYIAAGGAFIAAAFFPTDLPSRRRVLIDPSYFTTSFDHVGVLRHELGHTLGFRHEHIRSGAPSICPDEDLTGTIDLTAYDPQSVMHYFCGGVGSRNLAITAVDRTGAQLVYGPPLNQFELLQP